MPRGPVPKPREQRVRPGKPPSPDVVAVDGNTYGPALPAGRDWPVETLAWWETWRTCAQASRFCDTDWVYLLDTALLHARLWSGDVSVSSELRLRTAKFGATLEDRLRLRFAVAEPGGGVTSGTPGDGAGRRRAVPSAAERRARLLQAVPQHAEGNDG